MSRLPPDTPPFSGTQGADNPAYTPSLAECIQLVVDRHLSGSDEAGVNALHSLVIGQTERQLIDCVLRHTDRNQVRASAILGISRSTLRKKISLYNLNNVLTEEDC
jgi:Fis family transcriptional regulator